MAKDNKPRFTRPNNPPAQKASQQPLPPKPTPSEPLASSSPKDQTPTPTPTPTPETETPQEDAVPDLSKLPDLTQGIPSTLEYEMAGANKRSQLDAVEQEVAEEAAGGGSGRGGRPKGELPDSAYEMSADRRRKQLYKWAFILTGLSAVGGTLYYGRQWSDEEEARHPDVPNGWDVDRVWNRAIARFTDTKNYYQEPAFEKLLPDLDPSFARPYTLCISMEDMLVHSEWTRDHGWRMAKRPGVDYFIHYLSQYYEIVLFTSVPLATAEPVLRKLDPFRFIMWPLGREATKYKNGEIVKDLSYLNRDLSKVIIIDTDAKHVQLQPENAIVLPKWTGDPKDTTLVSLVPFLEFIHTMEYGDVRKVLKSFDGKDIPVEFARREALARADHQKRLEAMGVKKKSQGGGGLGFIGGLLGLKPSKMSMMVPTEGAEDPQEAFAQGKMLQDIARERGIRNYEMMEEEIRKNGAKWLKEEADMQEKLQKEAMKNITGWWKSPEPTEKNA